VSQILLRIVILLFSCQSLAKASDETVKSVSKAGKAVVERPAYIEAPEDDWLAEFYDVIADSVHYSAIWFDDFFVSENNQNQLAPKTSARIRLGWEPRARELDEIDLKFRLRLRLPYMEQWGELILTDSIDAPSDLPLQSNRSRSASGDSLAAAIRVVHTDDKQRLIDTRVGISSGTLFGRARVRKSFNPWQQHHFMIEPSVYYYLDDGWGSRLFFEYRYDYTKTKEYRIDYSVWGGQEFTGLRWKHGFYRLHQLTDKSATLSGLVVEGERNGPNGFEIVNTTLQYRYRFNALRKWLFFEIEPFIEFPREEGHKFTPGIAFRVEGFFNKG
jgi:hypothetical protein